MNSLSRGFLIAIGVTSLGVTLLSALAGFFVFRNALVAQQRHHLEEYLAERHYNLARRFSALAEVHQQAVVELHRQAAGLSDAAAHAAFEARYPSRADGTRRSRDEDFDGHWTAEGDYVRGMGAYLSPRLTTPLEETALAAAFSVVHHFGQGMHSSWDNFYFVTPNNKLVMYAPDRPDRLQFYRHAAPADLDFSGEEMMRMVSPANDPGRRTRCTALRRLIQEPKAKRLATACLTPVYLQGRYVGAFGSSIFVADFLANAVRPIDGDSTSLIVRREGDVLAFPGMLPGRDEGGGELARVTARFHVPDLMRRIQEDHAASGVLTSPDGRDLMAFARLDGPDWWFLLIYPKRVAAAAAARSAAWILALGVAAALAQAALIMHIARRRIVAPLQQLARSCTAEGDSPAAARALALRDDELGVLARALDVERENAGLVQASLEDGVRGRTAELEAVGRERSRFLCAMGHELRTPLNGVIAVSEALAVRQSDDESRRMVELVVESGRVLERVLADMVDVASLDAGDIALSAEPFNLGELLEHAGALHRPAAEAKGLRLDVVCKSSCQGAYLGDAERIIQVLSHYLANAVKCTDAGWVSLRVERGAGEALRFVVSDTGHGLDAAAQARLFQRTEARGSAPPGWPSATPGLGLAVCRAIAHAMGGEVAASSQPGVGSMFTLTVALPPAPAPPRPRSGDSTPPEGEARRFAGLRILLAEDHPVNQKVVALILANAGARLRIVGDGAQALDAFAQERFDLVLMDALMPEMDGVSVIAERRAQEAAEQLERTPIIVLTADTRREQKTAALKAGADLLVCKPIRAADLLSAMASVLPQPASAQAA